MSKETISEQGIALLNVLTPRQKEYALTLYSGREKKKSSSSASQKPGSSIRELQEP